MQYPPEISYREVAKTTDIENLIHEKVDKLEKICDHITSCHISIEKPQEHMNSGSPYRVRLDVRVPPSHELVARREPGDGDLHDPLDLVIRDVFNSLERQLKKITEKQRSEVKEHPQHYASALVDKLFDDYGFLRTIDDRQIYFHKNSVLNNDFDRLEIGTGVRFVEEDGEKGSQASTVQIVDKPGARPKNK